MTTMQTQHGLSKPTSRGVGRLGRWIRDQRRKFVNSERSHRGLHLEKQDGRALFSEGENISAMSVVPPITLRTSIRLFIDSLKRKSKMPSSVPFEIFLPCDIESDDRIVAASESESVRSPGQGDLEDALLELLCHRDVEVQARMHTIQIMGADHPAILLSLKYLGRRLCKLGDYQSALAVKNQMIALQQLNGAWMP